MVQIYLELGEAGAARAGERGEVVVIVDALRASVTAAVALDAGATRVIPVATIAEARRWLGRADVLLAGERDGAKIVGFHLGNSPTQMLKEADQLDGCTLVHTTTNGTRCITTAARFSSPAIYVGSLPNATPLVRLALHTAREIGVNISLIAAGVLEEPVEEDTLAVAWLGAMLERLGAVQYGDTPPVSLPGAEEISVRFARSFNGIKLAQLGYSEDVAYCAQIDVLNVVPVYQDCALLSASQSR